jgi:hypothetical protein
MKGRQAFAYVVSIDGSTVRLNLLDAHKGQMASHREGVSPVTEIGGLFGVDGGTRLLVFRVRSLQFAEPREAHRAGVGSLGAQGEPLRHLEATALGILDRKDGATRFTPDSLTSPALGAEAFPLFQDEFEAILKNAAPGGGPTVRLGEDARGGGALTVDMSGLLGRHLAVLGSTGHGKSSFTAAVLQQLVTMPNPRIVIFDINGEYEEAMKPHLKEGELHQTSLGEDEDSRIPYYALGRHGLSRLLLPSEKTQRPALSFALDCLPKVVWHSSGNGAGLAGERTPSLFSDCPPGDASQAKAAIDKLRGGSATGAPEWPPMDALACLVAESHSLKTNNRGAIERDAFSYGNVSPLITRINRFLEDPMFTKVVNVSGGRPGSGGALNWSKEGSQLCARIFGDETTTWKVHIINLRSVAHDLMPLVLGSLLELFAFELFRRGQGGTHPTLLVLEEAHHYLRQIGGDADDQHRNSLAYERLAKEGRKFGLGLWLSTQRPSEVSPTVLAQCGTWVVFRLTSEQDQRAVGAAGEWIDRQELGRIAGLPRRQALIFGSSIPVPVRIVAPPALPPPKSHDPEFGKWMAESTRPMTPEPTSPAARRPSPRKARGAS